MSEDEEDDGLVKDFGRAACDERLRQGLTQDALAKRSGLHRNFIGSIERGNHPPSLRTMARLARGLGVPLADLIAVAERGYERPYDGPQRRVGVIGALPRPSEEEARRFRSG